MFKQEHIMVIWSFLLLGSPAVASIEDVLAPVDATVLGFQSGEPQVDLPAVKQEQNSHVPLVEKSVDELDLLAELERLVSDRIQPSVTLRLVPVSQMPRVPKSAHLPEVVLLDLPSRITSRSILIRFRMQDDDRLLGDYAVTFRVQIIADVWTPNRRLDPGETLAGSDFATREVDLVREPKAVVADPSLLNQYEVIRTVPPERVLTWSDITPRALVRKGEYVEVVAREGLLSISMKGQALRNGSMGETVTIRNLESKREFSAEVIDENRVRVSF